MEENNNPKKDIVDIIKLTQHYDFSSSKDVSLVYNYVEKKEMLKSVFGIRFKNRLQELISGKSNEEKCVLCNNFNATDHILCNECRSKLSERLGLKNNSEHTSNHVSPTGNAIPSHATNSIPKNISSDELNAIAQKQLQNASRIAGDSLNKFTKKVNEMAGGEGSVDLHLKDFVVNVFKKHSPNDAEELFICGTSKTTPPLENISDEWPKPWLYSRVAIILFTTFYLFLLCWTGFSNTNVIPDIIFVGACVMPITVLVFFFEINVPRNISFFKTIKVFFVGGALSLFVTLIIFEVFPVGALTYSGAIMVGIIEEVGKLIVTAFYINKTKQCKYILNGLLIGGAVGAGFAAFESAGYAFRNVFPSLNVDSMVDSIYLRGFLAPGGHVAWAAITGAAIMIVLKKESFHWGVLLNKRFICLFIFPIALHAVWDMPLTILGSFLIKCTCLIAIAWIILIVLMANGLKEINRNE